MDGWMWGIRWQACAFHSQFLPSADYNEPSGAGWTSLWDEQGVALPALEQGWKL